MTITPRNPIVYRAPRINAQPSSPTAMSATDSGVVPENSTLFYLALRKANVPAELHIYETGPHGVGLAQEYPELSNWPDRLQTWLKVRGILKPKG